MNATLHGIESCAGRRVRRARRLALVLSVACLLPGCFNDWETGRNVSGGLGSERFALVIEPNRSDVDGTHFLVDRATGDLWRLAGDDTSGRWIKVADGPEDVKELVPPDLGDPDETPDEEG